jgi:hypothetical protein
MSASRSSTPIASAKEPVLSRQPGETRWGILRIALGVLQMFGASLSVVLLLRTGVSPVALTSVALTCLCTTASVLLFGLRSPRSRR